MATKKVVTLREAEEKADSEHSKESRRRWRREGGEGARRLVEKEGEGEGERKK